MSQDTGVKTPDQVLTVDASDVNGLGNGPMGRFTTGHPRIGGRKKGTPNKRTWKPREIAERKDFNPFEIAINIITKGILPPTKWDFKLENGVKVDQRKPIAPEERIKVLKELLRYLFPALSAQQITGHDGGPLAVASMDITALMQNPDLAEAAQKLAISISQQKPKEQ